jgi:hypothetical protein
MTRHTAALLACLLATTTAFAQQTDNYQLRAVPAAKPPVLDGKLDDWDLSGDILICYDLETMRDTHSVRAAAMYDRDHLYLSFRFKDRTPMVNHVHPVNELGSGWRSDCVQLRLWTDHDKPIGPGGARIAHLDCYYFTDEGRPSAFLTYNDMSRRQEGFEGKIDQAIGQGVDAAFKKDADGKGYVQEMRIAWKLLCRDGRPYVAGETLRMGIESFWGDPTAQRWPEHRVADLINKDYPQREFFWTTYKAWGEVAFLDHGNLPPSPSVKLLSEVERLAKLRYATEGPVPIEYELPADGFATLVVEKPDGTRVRNLVSSYPRKAGKNTDYWDGTDDTGRLVEPGEYRVRGLSRGDFDLRYQFTYGTPATPPWETSDNRGDWLADHVPPVSVATDGKWIFAACHMSEGGSTMIGIDETGQKRWGIGRIYGGMLAHDGTYLYMLAGGGHPDYRNPGELRLLRIDPKQGKLANFADGKSEHVIATFPKDRPIKTREWEGKLIAEKAFDAEWCQHEALGLAALKGKLYASMFYEDKIVVVSAETGEVTGEIALPAPAGLAADGKRLLAISGNRVVALDPDTRAVTPVVATGLAAPIGLAVDRQDNIYVSDWKDQMCVKVFSPDGKPLRKVGKLAGRPLKGRYEPDGMFRPRGLTVDDRGRLWVAEYDYSPKRISVWDRAGKLEREYCGPTWYAATGCNVNTANPRQAFCMGNIVDLDWDKGLWRVGATIWRPTQADELIGPSGEGDVSEVFEVDGRKILVTSHTPGFLCISELREDGARPLMVMGPTRCFLRGQDRFPEMVARKLWDDPTMLAWAKEEFPAVFVGGEHHRHRIWQQIVWQSERRRKPVRTQFHWTDANGDGRVQDPELRVFHPDEVGGFQSGSGWRSAYSPDLTLYPAAVEKGVTKVWRLDLQGWNDCGAPVYDLDKAELIYNEKPQHWCNSTWGDSEGNVLLNQGPMTMVSGRGKTLWTYPNRWPGVHGSHHATKDRHGLLIGPLKVIGAIEQNGIGEVFCINGNMGKAFLMTTDGLYLGSLFRDCRAAPDSLPDQPVRDMSIMRTSGGGEWFGGEFFRNRIDGKVYLGSCARNGSVISEVTGLETVKRLPGRAIAFTQAHYDQAAELLAKRAAEGDEQKRIEIGQAKKQMSAPPAVNQFSWGKKQAASWNFDPKRRATATWTFDDDTLYLCFRDVSDATPMINNGKVLNQLFKTGDAVAFELRTRADDDTPGVIEGDLRLLITVFEGEPIAILYRYKVEGTEKPVEFASPVTTTKIDVVKVLDAARVAIDRRPNAYDVRVSVPLAELGFKPEAGKTYRGDFGVIHSDVKGQINELRMYWSNRVTGIVSDLSIEAAIEPKRWGRWELKIED